MKKAISLFMVFLIALTLLGPVGVQSNGSVQLNSDEMAQISGGKTGCNSSMGFACCCLDLWIAQICICAYIPFLA